MPKLAIIFLALSIFCFVSAGIFVRQIVSPTVAFSTPRQSAQSQMGPVTPASLAIPSINLNLPITLGTIKNNRWPTSPTGLIFVSTSALPGSMGNSIIYGHNWKSLLGSLSQIKVGDGLQVTLSDGQVVNYQVGSVQEVSPQNDQVLEPTSDSRLTLYTCIGFLDSKRLVVVAKQV